MPLHLVSQGASNQSGSAGESFDGTVSSEVMLGASWAQSGPPQFPQK